MSGWAEYKTPEGYVYYYNEKSGETSWDKPAELLDDTEKGFTGNWVWMKDEVEAFIPVRVVSGEVGKGVVELESEQGMQYTVDSRKQELTPVMRTSLIQLKDDLVLLDDMNTPLIMWNIKKRCAKNKIYTNVGNILISVNPYKMLPLYTPFIMEAYRKRGDTEMDPHPYIIADYCYKALFEEGGMNQSILVSGESGAGKTVNTKIILQYLAEVAGSTTGVEQKILLANPVLEAFGNAKTIRNDNSSRFGKWIEIHFDRTGKICGAKIINYLLEKARVVHQAKGERNFHIFYQLCKAGSDIKSKYKITEPKDFGYINKTDPVVKGMDDEKEYKEMAEALKVLNFAPDEIDFIYRTTAGIMYIGNIEFESHSVGRAEGSKIKSGSKSALSTASDLLQIDANLLEKALVERVMHIPGQPPTTIPLNVVKAKDCRDTLAKHMYTRLFDYLVQRINTFLGEDLGNQRTKNIGILDIFGFEIFEKNSFEQMCINFANEKLQQKFNQTTFKEEEAVYRRERISFDHIDFIDNQVVLDLVEKKPKGLLVMLDDELKTPKGNDQGWLDKICRVHKGHERFKKVVKLADAFCLVHYAGEVQYDAIGFYDKNKDEMYMDLVEAVATSKVPRLAALVASEVGAIQRKKTSLSGQFREQLNDLMATINKTEPQYIRCVKPNEHKAPCAEEFDAPMSYKQLLYAGVFEAVEIRRKGYPFRYTHKKFMKRYRCLNPKMTGQNSSACKQMLDFMKCDTNDVQVGASMILYRAKEQRNMDLLRSEAIRKLMIKSQALFRRFRMRCIYDLMNTVRHQLRDAISARSIEKLGLAITASDDMPFQCKEHYDAQTLKHYLEEEVRLGKLMDELFPKVENVGDTTEDLRQRLTRIVEDGDKVSLQNDKINKARSMLNKFNMRIEARKEMQEGTANSDEEMLKAAIEKAKQYGIDMSESTAAAAVRELERIKKEKVLLDDLSQALSVPPNPLYAGVLIDKKGVVTLTEAAKSALQTAVKKGQDFKCKTEEGKVLMQTGQIILTIRSYISADNWDAVEQQVIAAKAMTLKEAPEMKAASDQVVLRAKIEETQAELDNAAQNFDSNALEIAIQKGQALEMDINWYQDLYNGIVTAYSMCTEAISEVNLEKLKAAVEYAESFGYNKVEVKQARELRDKCAQIEVEIHPMVKSIPERPDLEALNKRCVEINYKTDATAKLAALVALDDEALAKEQFDAAVAEGNTERWVAKKIILKDFFFKKNGTDFQIANCPLLKTPSEYAKPKTFGKSKLKKNMLIWTKAGLPTSLTVMEKVLEKESKVIHKNMLGFMGDKQLQFPSVLAKEILDRGLQHAKMRDEIYLQAIKQLTQNPNPESVNKGWKLLLLCLETFPPSDQFENYLEIWLRNTPKSKADDKFLKTMHQTIFQGAKSQSPSAEDIGSR